MGQQTAPQVRVVICHHTGSTLLLRCLDSVQRSGGVAFEVVVVTSDPTLALSYPIKQIYHEGGPSEKRNVGSTRTQTSYLVYLDDDVEISPYCLLELFRWMEDHPQCGMAFGKILNMERRREFDDCGSWLTWTGFLWARAGNSQLDVGQSNQPCPILASKSATCIVRRETFADAGGFDPYYFILAEETDLAWRCWLRGWHVWYCPSAVSWHAFGTRLKPRQDYYTIRRVQTYGCRNYLSLLWANLGSVRLAVFLPVHMCAWGLSVLGFLCRGDTPRAVAIMRGVSAWMGRLPHLCRQRRMRQSTRVLSDCALSHYAFFSPGVSYYLTRLWRYWTTQLHG